MKVCAAHVRKKTDIKEKIARCLRHDWLRDPDLDLDLDPGPGTRAAEDRLIHRDEPQQLRHRLCEYFLTFQGAFSLLSSVGAQWERVSARSDVMWGVQSTGGGGGGRSGPDQAHWLHIGHCAGPLPVFPAKFRQYVLFMRCYNTEGLLHKETIQILENMKK